jgi:dUTP pyrophosphatase
VKIQAGVYKIDPTVPDPRYATEGSVGFDLGSRETLTIPPGQVVLVPTGLVVRIPPGYYLQLAARSSLGRKKGLMLANGVGTVDTDYCGKDDEIRLAILNFTPAPVQVARGEMLAQGIFLPAVQAEFSPFEPEDKSRGGFGSTGGYVDASRGETPPRRG